MVEQSAGESKRHTPARPIRVPELMWKAYGRVCERLDTDRTNDLLGHMKARVLEHGTDADKADLARAEQELSERRARKGGRPAQS
ncbi:hypothetical protein [Streptomyces sp. NBC_01373]|uniref:hypothetical protein n=1 Tax=Streptomyces sp. NBC_01373 TaxID=2903843 RepID=UPI002257C5C1|nr:hypothetical protein [Streptomyces sp. NBC_01373]MCX4699550.1 hypothetical protein [Streptomyces sp. NBC_01373]